jgi:hypothetical protein
MYAKNLNRRDWLRHAAAGSGLAALGGFAGCGNSNQEAQPDTRLPTCSIPSGITGLNVLPHGLLVIDIEADHVQIIMPVATGHDQKWGCKNDLTLKPLPQDNYNLTIETPRGPKPAPDPKKHVLLKKSCCGGLGDLSTCTTLTLPFPDDFVALRPASCKGSLSGKTATDCKLDPDQFNLVWVLRYETTKTPRLLGSKGNLVWEGTQCKGGPWDLHFHNSMPKPAGVSHLPYLNNLFAKPLDLAIDGSHLPKTVPVDCAGAKIGVSNVDELDLMELGRPGKSQLGGADVADCLNYIYDGGS